MFVQRALRQAILRHDSDAIRALVARHGVDILAKSVPGRFQRHRQQPGDYWLKRVFKNPPPLSLSLLMADDETVAALVKLGASPQQALDHNFPNQLFVAAALGRVRVLSDWLQHYPLLRASRNEDNDHLLHIAAQHGQVDVAAFLMNAGGFPLDARSSTDGCTPLMYAARAGHAACTALLLDAEMQAHEHLLSPVALPAAAAEDNNVRWHSLDDQRIARRRRDTPSGARLTEIFNFSRQEVWQIVRYDDGRALASSTVPFNALVEPSAVVAAGHRLGIAWPPPRKKG